MRERYERLVATCEEVALTENRAFVGRDVEVLVTEGDGRKDADRHRLTGRAPDNRLVHFTVPDGAERPRPGDMATVQVTYAAPHYLVADVGQRGGGYAVRRTRAGDAHERVTGSQGQGGDGVLLGMPTVGAPA